MIVGFIAALTNFFDPIQQLSQLYTTYQSGMAALDKIFELLDEEPDLVDAPDATVARPRSAARSRSTTSRFAYRDRGRRPCTRCATSTLDRPARARPSRWSARPAPASRRSPSSSRASTTRPSGAILVDGHDLRDVTAHSLRSQMGIVPQEGFLFCGTIRDNIAFGRPDATDEESAPRPRAVGADELRRRARPTATTPQIGERGVQLSAGQRQLVAFARALIADPRILVLDEATSNVDIHTESRIEDGLRRLLAGRTAIVIAHRLSTIRHGRAGSSCSSTAGIVEQGTHDELIAAEGALLAALPRLGGAGEPAAEIRGRSRCGGYSCRAPFAGWSNGKTPASGAGFRGSSPCPAVQNRRSRAARGGSHAGVRSPDASHRPAPS